MPKLTASVGEPSKATSQLGKRQPTLSFLDLPVELRLQVYDHALLSHLKKNQVVKPNFASACHTMCEIEGLGLKAAALFRVSKLISREATQYFYGHLQFEITDDSYCKTQRRVMRDTGPFHACTLIDFKPFLLSIGTHNCASIRKLKITITRKRFLDDCGGGSSCGGSHFLEEIFELLSHHNNLNSLEIDFRQYYTTFSSLNECDTIMRQLLKLNGIQKVKIKGTKEDMASKTYQAKKKLEADLKATCAEPEDNTTKLLNSFDPNTSPEYRRAQKFCKSVLQELCAARDRTAQQAAIKHRLKILENEHEALLETLRTIKGDDIRSNEQLKALTSTENNADEEEIMPRPLRLGQQTAANDDDSEGGKDEHSEHLDSSEIEVFPEELEL